MVKRILKILGLLLLLLLLLAVVGGVAAMAVADKRLEKHYAIEIEAIAIPDDEAAIAEGERIFSTRGCIDCHEAGGSGALFMDDPMMGTIAASNLTSGAGGVGGHYEVEDWMRAILHGVRPDGSPLVIMPSSEFSHMRHEELAALIAYLQSLEPVDHILPERQLGPMGSLYILAEPDLALHAEVIDHDNVSPAEVAVEASVAYGDYLAHTACVGCHTPNFAGGGFVNAANLTPHEDGLGAYSYEEFEKALRTGLRPDGSRLGEEMPWQSFAALTDTEIQALWLYLQTLEPLPGN